MSCYCENLSDIYDDTFCTGLPLTESEPCNTDNCKSSIKPLSFWRENNNLGTADHNQPWPIPESTKFECDRGSDSIHSQMTWIEIINVSDLQVSTEPWIKLAREYIVSQLNIKNGNQIDSKLQQIITNSEWLLRDCDSFTENDEKAANLISQTLSESNSGNLPVYPLEEISSLIEHTDGRQKEPPSSINSTIISLTIAAFVVVVLLGMFLWKRNRAQDIVTYEPEFDLPDPDEEMIPSGIDLTSSGTVIVYGEEDEEAEVSYELGDLDEVNL